MSGIRPLEFSEKSLQKRLTGIHLNNIQGIKNLVLRVPISGIIRINAPSETGKSSCFKPFEALVTSAFSQKRDIISLVNEDSDTGFLEVLQYNATRIGVFLDKTNTNKCFYRIIYPDGREVRYGYNPLPDEVLDALGWYTTGIKSKDFCLNVRRDGPLAVVKTPKRLNSEIFSIALNSEELENTLKELEMSQANLNTDLNALTSRLENVQFVMNSLEVKDTSLLETQVKTLTYLKEQNSLLNELELNTRRLILKQRAEPKVLYVPDLTSNINQLEALQGLIGCVDSLTNLKAPDVKCVPDLTERFKNIDFCDELLNKLNSLNRKAPSVITCPDDIPLDTFEQCIDLDNLLVQLTRLISNPVNLVEEPENISGLLDNHQILCEILSYANNLSNTLNNISQLNNQEAQVEELLSAFKLLEVMLSHMSELQNHITVLNIELSKYQCPTCGQYIGQNHQHNTSA